MLCMPFPHARRTAHKAAEHGGRLRHEKRTASQVLMKQNASVCGRIFDRIFPAQAASAALFFEHRVLPSRSRWSVAGYPRYISNPYFASIRIWRFASLRELQKENDASGGQQKIRTQSIEVLGADEKSVKKKPICRKPLAKLKRICYNIFWVPVIRLYRCASFTSMQGCRIASATACLFVYGSIILQTPIFVNTFAGKSSPPFKKTPKPIDKAEKT